MLEMFGNIANMEKSVSSGGKGPLNHIVLHTAFSVHDHANK